MHWSQGRVAHMVTVEATHSEDVATETAGLVAGLVPMGTAGVVVGYGAAGLDDGV